MPNATSECLEISRRNVSAAWIWLLTSSGYWHCWLLRDWFLLCRVSAPLPGDRECACHKWPVVKCQHALKKNLVLLGSSTAPCLLAAPAFTAQTWVTQCDQAASWLYSLCSNLLVMQWPALMGRAWTWFSGKDLCSCVSVPWRRNCCPGRRSCIPPAWLIKWVIQCNSRLPQHSQGAQQIKEHSQFFLPAELWAGNIQPRDSGV